MSEKELSSIEVEELKAKYKDVSLEYFQSNHEGFLLDKLHEVGFSYDGIILNAGALTHTSIALSDAISAISSPVMEVHISDIHNREDYRKHSYLTEKCHGFVGGLGMPGYELALESLLQID